MEVKDFLCRNGIECLDNSGIATYNSGQRWQIPECDFCLVWDRQHTRIRPMRFKHITEVVNYTILEGEQCQFLIVKSDNLEKSKVYRRGTVLAYCKKIIENKVTYRMHNEGIDISGMKNYITLDEFIPWIAKVKLTGIDFSDLEFWSAFKFPRRKE